MTGAMDSVPLQQYICNLDLSSLPRVVKICSGVYFQGSIYEFLGNECCLSTGDLIKIVDIQLQKVICSSMESGEEVELPSDFKGLFQPSPEPPGGTQKKFFFSKSKSSGCREPQEYTLQEVLQSAVLRRKRVRCPDLGRSEVQLEPVYKVEAIMHFRNNVVKIDSTLDVEVVDVTEESRHVEFIKPLMLSEVLQMDEVLPIEVELLAAPESPAAFQSAWLSHLQKGCRVQIHGRVPSWNILASSHKGKKGAGRHFLLSGSYAGSFRRCPRTFCSTSELALSLAPAKKLQVVVTREHESREEEPLFSVGDRLEVLSLKKASSPSAMDVLVCCRDNGDEDKELIHVPLFVEAGFVEDVRDSRKYTLSEVVEHFQLPCEVKVVAKDCASDPLGSLSALRLEAKMQEPSLLLTLVKQPPLTFEIPPKWLDVPLFFTGSPVEPTPPASSSRVEELTEAFYYGLLRVLPSNTPAPPRPPKRRDTKSKLRVEGEKRATEKPTLSLSKSDSTPPASAKARANQNPQNKLNEYTIHYGSAKSKTPTKQATGTISGDDSDHDYEEICEGLKQTTRKMQRAALRH